jgi:hypothetical protein
MRPFDDYEGEMQTPRPLDDTTVNLLLTGAAVGDEDLRALSAFVTEIRTSAKMPAPPPSAALQAVLTGGIATVDHRDASPATARSALRDVPRVSGAAKPTKKLVPRVVSGLALHLATAGFGAKAAFGVTLAAASVTGAAAAGVLPDPIQHTVAGVVRALSPFEFPDRAHSDEKLDAETGNEDTEVDGSTSTDERRPRVDERGSDPEGQAPMGGAPADSGPELNEADPAASRSTPTTVPAVSSPPDEDPPADSRSGAPIGQPESTPTTQPGGAPVSQPVSPPTTQPEGISPQPDNRSGQPEHPSGGAPETQGATQPVPTSPTQPKQAPTNR